MEFFIDVTILKKKIYYIYNFFYGIYTNRLTVIIITVIIIQVEQYAAAF